MSVVWVVSLVGVLAMHLIATHFIWRSTPPGEIWVRLISLAVCSSAAWICVLVLCGFAEFLFGPFVLFPEGGSASTIDGRVFALTLGLPSIFSEDLSCISFLLLPPGLFALSLLPLLSRRGYGPGTFWITLISIGYSTFLFAGADVADISGKDGVWIAAWVVAGAVIGFLVKLAQTLVIHRSSVQDHWPGAGVILNWVMAGAASAMAGLLLGMVWAGDWSASHQPAFADSLPIMLAAILSGLLLVALIASIAGLTFGPDPGPAPWAIEPPNEPAEAQ